MEKARRPQVPAFGEWNYYYHYDEPEAAAWYAVPEPQACSDVWFKYPPPPRKPAPKKKQARRRRPADCDSVSRERQSPRRPSMDAAAAAAKGGASRRVVRPVDADLYQVPPPEFTPNRRPTKQRRSLWMMGCLGCVA
ncbi:uncharacterized protein LOC123396119 isoform X1 [Hordeum vulgare subsp. vulgare]|uniref:Uncharacterized protein n=1 Tax=Hordeum vulgare subsp. vulgare TaxID=112509 RepID=A0A8I6YI70_HORVV|nr:uncharacterized protein LOC123396119 isoform X1 [Hordeum vulgare subsp. vulgare]KAI4988889.1 hypothetical protein ZWY2020_036206 [Hordeum vulgare]